MISGNVRYTGDINKPYKITGSTLIENLVETGDPITHWLEREGSSSLLYEIAVKAVELLEVKQCQIIVLGSDGLFHPIAFHWRNPAPTRRNTGLHDSMRVQERLQRIILLDQVTIIRSGDKILSQDERFALRAHTQDNLLIVPMRLDTEPVGVFVLNFEEYVEIEKKIQLAQLFSKQAAIALHREGLPYADEDSVVEIVMALSKALEARDLSTGAHCRKITRLTELMAVKIGCSFAEVQSIRRAALLHDIGKIGIPDQILHKPGPLTDKEWVVMRQHPEIGARILRMIRGLSEVSRLVLAHHERYDGSGYPYGLSGESIPIGARILAVVDAYGAMVVDRVYRPAKSYREAIDELRRCAGKDFDPIVVDVFLNLIETTMDGLDDVG
jgi:putative nucleotidyltransferase with HDIG domain